MFSAALDWLSQLPLLLISGPNNTGPRKLILNPSQVTAQSSDWQTMLMDYSNKEDDDDDDEFFDCVSVMSAVEKALTPTVSGLESSSRFYPEQYTINTATLQRIHVIAMVPQRETALGRIDSFYFWYNEGPRKWRRIIANVHVSRDSRHFAATVVASPDDFFKNLDLLPAPLQFAFTKLLDNTTLKHAVTRLDLSLEDRPSEQNMCDIRPQGGEVQPLEPEATKYLDMCSDIGTPIYTEDDVVTYSSATSTLYVVSLGTKLCIERRLPFDSNAMAIFWQNLKLLHCMAESTAVISLVGVVVHENRSQPRGFLYEYLRYQSIGTYLEDADLDGETIPWARREKWARQIVQSIADCHARGFTIGDTGCLRVFGLDPYDDAKLVRIFGLTPSQHTCDSIPPELRSNSQSKVPYKTAEWTTRCDLFRLGQCLWMLAQRKVKVCSQLCPSLTCSCDSCCTLPSDNSDATMGQSLQDAPSYYKHLIRVSLSSNPNERLPASTLLNLFPPVHSPFGAMTKQSTPAPAKVWPAFSNPSFWCDICDMKVSGDLYHCGICNDGNYDICAPCISDGLHCKDTEHPLVRRAVSNGVLVSLSDYELQVRDKSSNAIVEPVLMQMK
ncbi:hypothetical protein BU24DRAFT_21229 [Aaosphaeria arxii CBS 175.79]|uniref:Protein kinase domain-containing protein n=1 Tax=Aaosphaeria arxii CBS 175.79 TaxID=1450172 RepID=A0A6A5Y7G0_9PLEO|nr:uncharacterized protein BU24DRAFT_21229 [Aaosphaeria arxii CBS 175.79]KAF2021468.1 hypothetical protein BU24DRAFT_21229 [Aaosphaeria arxii CBS 175.79]